MKSTNQIRNPSDVVISREAGDKKKGDRFQKLRACIRLLTAIGQDESKRIYCAIELFEDSFLIPESGESAPSIEENKNYGSALTFNSSPVKNTIVAFIDLDFRFFGDSSIRFSFYASATAGDEQFDEQLYKEAGLDSTRKTSILKKLCRKESLSDDELALCKAAILKEYGRQYAGKPGQGYLATITTWTIEQFGQFLSKIEWVVTTDGNSELESIAIDSVRKCPFYSYRHEGMESVIVGAICSEFEKRSECRTPMPRLLGTADIENIFLKTLGTQSQGKPVDPAHGNWDTIELTDIRNLEEKIEAVTSSNGYPPKRLKRLKLRVGLAKDEARLWQREYVSLRRRIFDVCEEILDTNGTERTSSLTPTEIDAILTDMVDRSMDELTRLNKTYHYSIQDENTLRGAILSLFDECYLAFD